MPVLPCLRRLVPAAAALAALLAAAPHARAFPDFLTLHDVVFDDGGTASGSFTLNVSGFLTSPTSIVTTAGTALGGASYNLSGFFSNLPTTVDLTIPFPPAPHAYEEGLNLVFAQPLGSVEIDPIVAGSSCEFTNYVCSGSGFRTIVSGYAEIPEPATAGVLGGALLCLGAARRRFWRRNV